jgi:hypothetical protein
VLVERMKARGMNPADHTSGTEPCAAASPHSGFWPGFERRCQAPRSAWRTSATSSCARVRRGTRSSERVGERRLGPAYGSCSTREGRFCNVARGEAVSGLNDWLAGGHDHDVFVKAETSGLTGASCRWPSGAILLGFARQERTAPPGPSRYPSARIAP